MAHSDTCAASSTRYPTYTVVKTLLIFAGWLQRSLSLFQNKKKSIILLSLVSIEKNIRKKCCHTTRHSLYIYSIHPPVHNAIPRIFIEKTAEFLVVDFFPLLILKWTLRCFAYRFASQYTSRMVPANLCKKKQKNKHGKD